MPRSSSRRSTTTATSRRTNERTSHAALTWQLGCERGSEGPRARVCLRMFVCVTSCAPQRNATQDSAMPRRRKAVAVARALEAPVAGSLRCGGRATCCRATTVAAATPQGCSTWQSHRAPMPTSFHTSDPCTALSTPPLSPAVPPPPPPTHTQAQRNSELHANGTPPFNSAEQSPRRSLL
jgi:hypothetical protein